MDWLLLDPPIDPGQVADTSWLANVNALQIIGGVLVLGLIIWAVRKFAKAIRPVHDFLDDWNGEPERPGVPGRPGVMARLDRMESHLTDAPTRRELTEVKSELSGVKEHLARHDVEIARLMPPPSVHTTINTGTPDTD